MRATTLYCITNTVNGKLYVGITAQTVHRRWLSHKNRARHGAPGKFSAAIRKYGDNTFEVSSLFVYPTTDEAKSAEISLISALDLQSSGYNLAAGGEGAFGHKRPPAAVAASSTALRGRKRPPEVIAKISATLKGRVRSPVHTARISASLTGKRRAPFSAEHRMHMSLAHQRRLSSARAEL